MSEKVLGLEFGKSSKVEVDGDKILFKSPCKDEEYKKNGKKKKKGNPFGKEKDEDEDEEDYDKDGKKESVGDEMKGRREKKEKGKKKNGKPF